ncbi:hypothetical protein EON80_04645 [bacterium]|nr:MAG: hypothetical protein EON80_04645 [bacterium]
MRFSLIATSLAFIFGVAGAQQGPPGAVACAGCVTLDFDKKIERHLIEPMLKMTTAQKLAYVKSFGIELYRVHDPENGKVTTLSLATPPVREIPALQRFVDMFKTDLLGIYLTPSNYSYRVKHPTILYIDSADDWTIIHEFSMSRQKNCPPLERESASIRLRRALFLTLIVLNWVRKPQFYCNFVSKVRQGARPFWSHSNLFGRFAATLTHLQNCSIKTT